MGKMKKGWMRTFRHKLPHLKNVADDIVVQGSRLDCWGEKHD
jgi:hypothetical protein